MSPDNYKRNPLVKQLIASSEGIASAFPHLARFLVREPESFRGLSMFIGDTADIVVGLRTFSDDGTPMILWSSGADPMFALINLNKACGAGNFKVDTKAVGGDT